MLNVETKRKIDAARDVLVGKVPDPKGQIDQITNALIYKFMDDMDEKARSIGGNATFFTGDLKKYAWKNLMDPSLGAQEKLNVYSEALGRFSTSENLPKLFRDIFRQAYLPYKDPNTLNLFLKEIDYFDYAHSEDLGDAFEYLLSVMGSQGDAGQFRTPRHIIDFIVKVVAPTKDETILDPACGTAGFLISAYKNILADHDGLDNKTGEKANSEKRLTYSEKQKLMEHLVGYDISPEMAKLARVNMYLHGAKNPNIFEYDSLSSDTRWEENFDVILANPPFMTPKGGIVPHRRFGVESNRAEVLFVDYIKEHLTQNGRAGIVVPEGVIFQSGKAYKSLRKSLVENNFLVAVISLPSGVFQPYSGVKTSILIIDKKLAKQKDEILFIKVENDGYDLGSQRREINKNNLPETLEILNLWKKGERKESGIVQYVSKKEVSKNEDYNLRGDRYKIETDYSNAKWSMVELKDICEIKRGTSITKKDITEGNIPVIAGGQQPAYFHNISNREGETITISGSGAYAGFVAYFNTPLFASDCFTVKTKGDQVLTKFIYFLLKNKQDEIYKLQSGGGQPHVYPKDLEVFRIPLPPLEIQEQIVKEIDGYQKIIDGAKMVVENWKPKIDIDPNWQKVKLGDVCKVERGASPRPIDDFITERQGSFNWIKIGDTKNSEKYIESTAEKISQEGAERSRKVNVGDFILSNSMSFGKPFIMKIDGYIHDGWLRLVEDPTKLGKDFLYYTLHSENVKNQFESAATGGVVRNLNSEIVRNVIIFVPSLDVQATLVAKIGEEEECLVGSKKLIRIYEEKIKNVIHKVYH